MPPPERKRSLHERLAARRTLLGLMQMDPHPALMKKTVLRGYDFLVLDGEHGTFTAEDFRETLEVLAATDVVTMVRLARHDTDALRRYLDMGADAIVVPHVETPEQARTLVHAMNVPRNGACLIVILESVLGVSNAATILALEGVDGALIGFNDLTAELSTKGDFAQPAYAEAISRVEQAAAEAGKCLGTAPHGSYSLQVLHARGHRLLILGTNRSLLCEAMGAEVMRTRALLNLHD